MEPTNARARLRTIVRSVGLVLTLLAIGLASQAGRRWAPWD
jgi:hypothetical protein